MKITPFIWGVGVIIAVLFVYDSTRLKYSSPPYIYTMDCLKASEFLEQGDKGQEFPITVTYEEVASDFLKYFSAETKETRLSYVLVEHYYTLPYGCSGEPQGVEIVHESNGVINTKSPGQILIGVIMILGSTLGIFLLLKAFPKSDKPKI